MLFTSCDSRLPVVADVLLLDCVALAAVEDAVPDADLAFVVPDDDELDASWAMKA
jgi:hypothetical protein